MKSIFSILVLLSTLIFSNAVVMQPSVSGMATVNAVEQQHPGVLRKTMVKTKTTPSRLMASGMGAVRTPRRIRGKTVASPPKVNTAVSQHKVKSVVPPSKVNSVVPPPNVNTAVPPRPREKTVPLKVNTVVPSRPREEVVQSSRRKLYR